MSASYRPCACQVHVFLQPKLADPQHLSGRMVVIVVDHEPKGDESGRDRRRVKLLGEPRLSAR
jgi:hypothetical protein